MGKIVKEFPNVSLVPYVFYKQKNFTDVDCIIINATWASRLRQSQLSLAYFLEHPPVTTEIQAPEIQFEYSVTTAELKNLFDAIEKTSPQARILKISKLGFVSADINDEGASICSEFLRKDPLMTHFNLENNKITTKGAKELADIFKVNTTLVSLDLKGNPVGTEPEGKEILNAIEEGCKRNKVFVEEKYTPLHIAAYMDDQKKIKELIITQSGLTPLEIAQKQGHFKSVELLLGSKNAK
eukprot:Pompholyxophrys_punicea_v1_NODE_183_length_2949_cov_1.855218.p2 type:complete len:240 gc:universal NODE_183_length_2949_cov_1.855218:2622-1903(-)